MFIAFSGTPVVSTSSSPGPTPGMQTTPFYEPWKGCHPIKAVTSSRPPYLPEKDARS